MLAQLPRYIIHSILLISVAVAESEIQASPRETCGSASDGLTGNGEMTTPLTLWDLGFSLREKWADLREEEACPASPSDILLETDDHIALNNQTILDEVAASLHPDTPGTSSSYVPENTGNIAPTVPTPGDDFVSFEDWKRKNEEDDDGHEIRDASETSSRRSESEDDTQITEPAGSSHTSPPKVDKNDSRITSKISIASNSNATEAPLKSIHKYNYASPDCSARIHSSSSSTQHASSLLHKSRDRYMLTPCKAEEHWVVVELCDEIRIEAVEIAVWEFFSGVVREVRVSVGGEDDDDGEDHPDDDVNGRSSKWQEVGAFVGKNVRGVQTFTLSQPTAFHRFLRLDFPSYYGTEYYCPVSQLKVYGMNQMEAFKWEQKRSLAAAKEKDKEKSSKDREAEERRLEDKQKEEVQAREERRKEDEKREKELGELERLVREQARRTGSMPEPTSFTTESTIESKPKNTTIATSSGSTGANVAENVTTQANNSTQNSSTSSYSRSSPPRSDSSESIYAFIIRRLNALEGNSSLVARYIEEQTKVMRLMLGRVEKGWDEWKGDREVEDRTRWERERMRHEDRLGRVLSQMEQQRIAMDIERKAILAQLRLLADEIGYERRRGIAQLFLMLVIIILGVASRSSTIDAVLKPLLAEARRRKSIYRKSVSGPLSGIHIEVDKSFAPRQSTRLDNHGFQSEDRNGEEASSPEPLPINDSPPSSPIPDRPKKSITNSISRSSSIRRPTTPLRKRQTDNSNYRSFSETVPSIPFPVTSDRDGKKQDVVIRDYISQYRPTSPINRPRVSLPHRPGGQRRLARSAHLHTIEADRVRERVRNDLSAGVKSITTTSPTPFVGEGEDEKHSLNTLASEVLNGDNEPTPRRQVFPVVSVPSIATMSLSETISPLSIGLPHGVFGSQPDFSIDGEDSGDWGTDVGSASEAEEDLDRNHRRKDVM